MKMQIRLMQIHRYSCKYTVLPLDFPLIDHLEEPAGATFKAVLIAVYMPKTLQTKCKTCFGGPRMILYGLLKKKNTF